MPAETSKAVFDLPNIWTIITVVFFAGVAWFKNNRNSKDIDSIKDRQESETKDLYQRIESERDKADEKLDKKVQEILLAFNGAAESIRSDVQDIRDNMHDRPTSDKVEMSYVRKDVFDTEMKHLNSTLDRMTKMIEDLPSKICTSPGQQ